ncbi:MAG: zinc ribbon domain-containing protein [Leptospiraceae bacterium]|nr:zinc ribbon domain-containing protein [Leptospiraceae bacterium]
MPTYDYACSECGHGFEKFHSMSESPEYTCPACNSKNVSRKISGGSGIIFKGSGFYVTDYKKSGDAASSKPAESASKSSGDSKPSKPESKATTTTS